MNKQEMIKAIAQDTKLTQVDVAKVLTSLEATTHATIAKGEKVQLTGFVTIKPVGRAARKGFDPLKNVPIEIDATVGVSVKAGEKLKTASAGLNYADFAKATEDGE